MKFARSVAISLLLAGNFALVQDASAGLTFFSRANCMNNESISWDWPGNSYWLWTDSYHYDFQGNYWEPRLSTGWEYTFWSKAVHWGEGFRGGYYVVGDHFMWVDGYGVLYLGRTPTDNCNLGFFFPYW